MLHECPWVTRKGKRTRRRVRRRKRVSATGAKVVAEEVVSLVVQFLIMVLSRRMAVEYQMRFSEACRMAVLVVDEAASSFRV